MCAEKARSGNGVVGSVLVAGGGIAGIQAALDLANSGYYVHLVEKSPAIGGIMAQLDKTFPTNDCSMCIISPKLVECGQHPNINLLTLCRTGEVLLVKKAICRPRCGRSHGLSTWINALAVEIVPRFVR